MTYPPIEHRGWYSRGYLPHFDQPNVVQMITFRLADSLPAHVLESLRPTVSNEDDAARRRWIEAYLDASHGSCALRNPEVGELVESALLYFDDQRYRLLAWVVMPNHVHALAEVAPGYRLPDIVQSWKSFTAKAANKILGRTGEFWQPEYFDRYIRDAAHFEMARAYIHENPVKAGLACRAEDWLFSSARRTSCLT